MPAVSAIITTRNRPELLARAVESVKHQTFKDIEIIVVDDASDNGPDPQASSDPDIRYIYILKEESKGGNYARNVGIRNSTGKYIAFLDDDDCWMPEKTEMQVRLFEERDCDLVYCGRRVECIENESTHYYDVLPDPDDQGDMNKRALYSPCCLTSTIMVSRTLFDRMGMWDEKMMFWQDHDFLIRAAQYTPFYFVDQPLCLYRKDLTDRQRMSNKFFKWKKAVRYVHRKHRALYSGLPFKERLEARNLALSDAMRRSRIEGLKGIYLYHRALLKLFYTIPKKYYTRSI